MFTSGKMYLKSKSFFKLPLCQMIEVRLPWSLFPQSKCSLRPLWLFIGRSVGERAFPVICRVSLIAPNAQSNLLYLVFSFFTKSGDHRL